jgi:hypothetical protein
MSKRKHVEMSSTADELDGFRVHGVKCSDYDTFSSLLSSWHPELVGTFHNTYREGNGGDAEHGSHQLVLLILNLLYCNYARLALDTRY